MISRRFPPRGDIRLGAKGIGGFRRRPAGTDATHDTATGGRRSTRGVGLFALHVRCLAGCGRPVAGAGAC